MKTKRIVASPKMLIFFILAVCVALGGFVYYLVYSIGNPAEDPVVTVFLSGLLLCMAVALFVIGFTMGAFNVVSVREEELIVLRFARIFRRYRITQNTQIYVQKRNNGTAQYIEVQFPEYFASEEKGIRGSLFREGYVNVSYSNRRLDLLHKAVLNYKENIAPVEQPPLPIERQ